MKVKSNCFFIVKNKCLKVIKNTHHRLLLFASLVLVTTFSRELWLPLLEGIINKQNYEALNNIFIVLRIIAIFFMLFSSIIVGLSKSALRRNNYIDQVEELLDEYKEVSSDQYNTNPNNYQSNS